jgi:hypothetical protein
MGDMNPTGDTPSSTRDDGALDPPAARATSRTAVDRYRALIGSFHATLTNVDVDDITASSVDTLVRPTLEQTDARTILGSTPGGVDGVLASLRDEVDRFRPGSPSSAADVAALVRIYLLSQIDSFWWRDVEPFHDADLTITTDLRDLDRLSADGQLAFRFKRQPKGLAGRARDAVVRRWMPGREPHTAGLSQAMARPELVGMLNEIARDFAQRAPTGTPPLWVTSMLRTVEQQHRLRDLGYSAVLPSAHCAGYAADVEMRWYTRFGADNTLAATLLDYQARGLVNVVDEGQAWHLCLSPLAVAEHRAS